MASGTPEDIAKAKRSYTGAFLKRERGAKRRKRVESGGVEIFIVLLLLISFFGTGSFA